eukprot:CAMPEP_0114663882 /NCGR_PEP_ID=MMETSP0191-20121206/27787_1 /TAXON_ID=126664 /ORGANISM="Sorites sp." /LENGTH=154 /DNA_ID=CAMNT_0001904539 /DNA_START=92 /DNA_END=556 /DNA_ORIENTATION=+
MSGAADTFFNDERVEELETAFKLKANDQGKMEARELGNLLRHIGINPTLEEEMDMEAKADPGATGFIEFKDFLECLKGKFAPPFPEDKLDKAFSILRNPKTKNVEIDEIKHYLKAFNTDYEISNADLDDFCNKVPKKGKSINTDEFIMLLVGKK